MEDVLSQNSILLFDLFNINSDGYIIIKNNKQFKFTTIDVSLYFPLFKLSITDLGRSH